MSKTNGRMFFSYAGVACQPGGTMKMRWSNDIALCVKRGSNDLMKMTELPKKMHKLESIKYLLSLPEFKNDKNAMVVLEDALDAYQSYIF